MTSVDATTHSPAPRQFTDSANGNVYVVSREETGWTVIPDGGKAGIHSIVADSAEAAMAHFRAHFEDAPAPDDFIVVRGGLVENTPNIPVFDLDVLESDGPADQAWIDELLELAARITEHPAAAQALRQDLLAIEAYTVCLGSRTQCARLRAIWEAASPTTFFTPPTTEQEPQA